MSTDGPDVTILRELLSAPDKWVSGTHLAAKLGMTRVAVWAHMQRLTAQGFEFEAQPSKGYKLTGKPERISGELLNALLRIRLPIDAITVLDSVDSTNSEAERKLAAGHATPFAVFAATQTNGRGRFGRAWHSPDQGNLYASYAFKPRVDPARMHLFTLWMGANICELLETFSKITPSLKWPNDIMHEGRKLGGMLTEARIDSDQIRDLIFGIGLNVNARSANWPREIARTATTLSETTGARVDLNHLAAAVSGRVFAAFEVFMDRGFEDKLVELWQRYDGLSGLHVGVNHGGKITRGIASGIDAEGSLVVTADYGRKLKFRAGEVTLEKPVNTP